MKDKLPKTGEEIEALRIALALCGIGVGSETACLLNEIFKSVQKLGGKFSIADASRIRYEVEKRYRQISVVAEPISSQNPNPKNPTG